MLRKREATRKEIRSNLKWPDRTGEVPEIVIVSLSQQRKYGETDRRILQIAPSPWLKFEINSLDDRGVDVIQSIQHVVDGATRHSSSTTPPPVRSPCVLSGASRTNIEHIDWEPDPAYGSPRFYVRYRWRSPIKKTLLRSVGHGPDGYAYELHGVKYKGKGGHPLKRVKRWWNGIRLTGRTGVARFDLVGAAKF